MKGKKERAAKGGRGDLEAPLVSVAAPPPAPPREEWQPTRTGHLAIGARETGVKVVM